MQAHANFTYPIPEMDLLNALDDAALEQIIFAEKESDYEVYVDHPSNTVSIKLRKALKPFVAFCSFFPSSLTHCAHQLELFL